MNEPRVIAILKCFAPDGAPTANVLLYADGSAGTHGDDCFARAAIAQLPRRRGRPPKLPAETPSLN
ncbi:MAG: hypothetical protein ABMA13_22970 [Chthoniobacteraceae bacterium]